MPVSGLFCSCSSPNVSHQTLSRVKQPLQYVSISMIRRHDWLSSLKVAGPSRSKLSTGPQSSEVVFSCGSRILGGVHKWDHECHCMMPSCRRYFDLMAATASDSLDEGTKSRVILEYRVPDLRSELRLAGSKQFSLRAAFDMLCLET